MLCTFCSTAGSPGWTLHTEAFLCDPLRYHRYRRYAPSAGSDSEMSAVVDVPSPLRVTTYGDSSTLILSGDGEEMGRSAGPVDRGVGTRATRVARLVRDPRNLGGASAHPEIGVSLLSVARTTVRPEPYMAPGLNSSYPKIRKAPAIGPPSVAPRPVSLGEVRPSHPTKPHSETRDRGRSRC